MLKSKIQQNPQSVEFGLVSISYLISLVTW